MRNSSITGEQLANSLHALGVEFIMGGNESGENLRSNPAGLIAALVRSREARLRLALIPLFLEHPEFSAHVQAAASNLPNTARLTLQCYYTAAVWLQQKHRERLQSLIGNQPPLADIFGRELSLQSTNDPAENLQKLAHRHQELGGEKVNWLGTYQHAAYVWLKGLENRNARKNG
jgi:hypothetical protein